jgi:hypothetical protein
MAKIPTTLSAIERSISRRLVARGYANTAVTLFMLGIIDTLPSPRQNHFWLFEETDGM